MSNQAHRMPPVRVGVALLILGVLAWVLLAALGASERAMRPIAGLSGVRDLFALVLPVLMSALAYWLGAEGRVAADRRAAAALEQARQVLAEADARILQERELVFAERDRVLAEVWAAPERYGLRPAS